MTPFWWFYLGASFVALCRVWIELYAGAEPPYPFARGRLVFWTYVIFTIVFWWVAIVGNVLYLKHLKEQQGK